MEVPVGPEEREVFGRANSFSSRWTAKHGIINEIPAIPYLGINQPFFPAQALSEISEIGLTHQTQLQKASLIAESTNHERFKVAFHNGFMRLIAIDQAMKSGRIDSVAGALENGPSPQGIAQWLLVDDETRRSLALLFKLTGIEAKDETDPENGYPIHDSMYGLDADNILIGYDTHSFKDVVNISPQEIQKYLKIVQDAVGTDSGVVRLAYTIFRTLGFAHENGKFAGKLHRDGLWAKHWVGVGGDLATEDIAPFVYSLKDPDTNEPLVDIIQNKGIKGLALALNRQPAEKIAREWKDMNLVLDMMDKICDIRDGVGGSAALPPEKRLSAIKGLQEFAVVFAKRRLTQETFNRLINPKKISKAPEAAKLSFIDDYLQAIDLGLFKKKPGVKG